MKTIKLIILLLSCCLVSGCLDKYLGTYDTHADFVLINEAGKELKIIKYYLNNSAEERERDLGIVGINDTTILYSQTWSSKFGVDDELFDLTIIGKYTLTYRIVFRDEAGNVVKEWYAKDADSEPGNFFNRDSWEYKKSPHYEPYGDGKASGTDIVWTFRLKENL